MNKYSDKRFKAHPWHGIFIGVNAPEIVMSFIEMTPYDLTMGRITFRHK